MKRALFAALTLVVQQLPETSFLLPLYREPVCLDIRK